MNVLQIETHKSAVTALNNLNMSKVDGALLGQFLSFVI
jgi:hypothetical protein